MRRKQCGLLLLAPLFCIGVWFVLGGNGCNQDGTLGPAIAVKLAPSAGDDYVVYFKGDVPLGGDSSVFYGYHSQTGELDTIRLGVRPRWRSTVSADGQRLYLPQVDRIAVVDIETQGVVAELPYKTTRGVVASPDNRFIAILGDTLRILHTSDHSVFFTDPIGAYYGAFSFDAKAFYCAAGGAQYGNYAYRVQLEDGFATHQVIRPGRMLKQVIPSSDGKTWFMYSSVNSCQSVFEVYDIAGDSVLFEDYMEPGSGWMALAPGGEYLFYTNAGVAGGFCTPPPSSFKVFDVTQNEIHAEISTVGAEDGTNPAHMAVGEMAMTPDGRYLVLGEPNWGPSFVVFDVQQMQLTDYFRLDNVLTYYSCQNAL